MSRVILPAAPAAPLVSLGLLTALRREERDLIRALVPVRGWSPASETPQQRRAGISIWRKPFAGGEAQLALGALGRAGQANAGVETVAFLDRCSPHVVVLAGIAGSLQRSKTAKADVVFGSKIRWVGQNKMESGSPCPVYRLIKHEETGYDEDVVGQIDDLLSREYSDATSRARGYKVFLKEIHSWDYVLSCREKVEALNREYPEAYCVEMEAGGFLKACRRYEVMRGAPGGRKVPAFVVRGLSDFADAKDNDEPARRAAAERAGCVALSFLDALLFDDAVTILSELGQPAVHTP